MAQLLYNIGATLAAPAGAAWLALSPRHRPLLRRFAPHVPMFERHPIWIQSCSVGELGVARTLIEAWGRTHPDIPALLTVSTVSGYAMAQSNVSGASLAWFPFDLWLTVHRFLNRAEPRLLALIETELWPAALRATAARRIPIVLVNGRISDRHLTRYKKAGSLIQNCTAALSAAGMQTAEYAARVIELGAAPERVEVTGNLKFDSVDVKSARASTARLREALDIEEGSQVLVFGSTRPGDEALAASCWRHLRLTFPDLSLVVAPRHVERVDEVVACFDEPVLRRSAGDGRGRSGPSRVIVLDTLGELAGAYGLATVAVIGGSFFPGVNGHNPIEPAAVGAPIVFGPFMRNFDDAARALREAGGAVCVTAPEALLPALESLLEREDERVRLGNAARSVVELNKGATTRTMAMLERVLIQHAGTLE